MVTITTVAQLIYPIDEVYDILPYKIISMISTTAGLSSSHDVDVLLNNIS